MYLPGKHFGRGNLVASTRMEMGVPRSRRNAVTLPHAGSASQPAAPMKGHSSVHLSGCLWQGMILLRRMGSYKPPPGGGVTNLSCHSSAPTALGSIHLHSSAERTGRGTQWIGPSGLGVEERPARRPPSPKAQGCRKALALATGVGIT